MTQKRRNKKRFTTMLTAIYSGLFIFFGVRQSLRSCRRIRLRPNPLGIVNVCAKPKINAYKPLTNGYTRPL